jgi:hypothetical protein
MVSPVTGLFFRYEKRRNAPYNIQDGELKEIDKGFDIPDNSRRSHKGYL